MKDSYVTLIVVIVGLFALLAITINNAFIVATPPPESPEMQAAQAEIAIRQAEANIQNQYLYSTYAVAIGIVAIGILFWLTSAYLTARMNKHISSEVQTRIFMEKYAEMCNQSPPIENQYAINGKINEH